MTNEEREEALAIMNVIIYMIEKQYDNDRIERAVDTAIAALKAEPCEDAVSREAVLDALHVEGRPTKRFDYVIDVKNDIMSLPPVTPKPKTGKWEMPQKDDGMSDPIYYQVRCSKCGFDLDPQTWHMELHQYGGDKFCPHCGAKMEGE